MKVLKTRSNAKIARDDCLIKELILCRSRIPPGKIVGNLASDMNECLVIVQHFTAYIRAVMQGFQPKLHSTSTSISTGGLNLAPFGACPPNSDRRAGVK